MSKKKSKSQKKKRDKRYRGEEAAQTGQVVHRIKAKKQSKLSLFWEDHKIGIITRAVQLGFLTLVGLAGWFLFGLIF